MFRSILIANRGEIACRIIRTCRRMGIRSIAVYSEADRGALHVAAADHAVPIGPPEAAHSYLNAEAIVAAARESGAEAVHPGYGFLSERALLPRRLADARIGWIGPHVEAIERMGSKRAAKALARAAGVGCVPGYAGGDQSDPRLAAEAARIGFPLLVKASAGGGGRGMRRVDRETELHAALIAARAEAEAAFGNAELLLEKLVARPRHLEVQLAGDRHGRLVHLFERECSIQRHYQKLIEEAPAPNLSETVRERLFDAALRLGRAIGYDSLGTAEFILEEGSEQPWFLEMNTRVQVEHPVTEAITGIDLIEWQIRAAAGETLPLAQDALRCHGHAIEVRLCAEDPALDHRPASGTVLRFDPPSAEWLRVETGVGPGSLVTAHYDSLLVKLIAHGPDRATARRRLAHAIETAVLLGVPCNLALLRDVVAQPDFVAGRLSTRFLAEAFPLGWRASDAPLRHTLELAAGALWLADAQRSASGPGPWGTLGGFRLLARAGRHARATVRLSGPGGSGELLLEGDGGNFLAAGESIAAEISRDSVHVRVGAQRERFAWARSDGGYWLQSGAIAALVEITAASESATAASGTGTEAWRIIAPMPGLIGSVDVEAGDEVELGQVCVTMEAMKVIVPLAAGAGGRVARVLCAPGETVAEGAVLIELQPD